METAVEVWYPTEQFGEVLYVVVEPGETLVEAITDRGDARYEFVVR
jgi:hypothetical protein